MTQNKQNKQPLFELLKEDQEPFFLKDYIVARKRNTNKTLDLHYTNKQRPTPKPIRISQQKHHYLLCQKASCFHSSSSPSLTKSPLFEIPSPISLRKSPSKTTSSNPILLHVPARTAALLLEAALRIQKQSSNPKPKPQKFGLFGSLLKRLTSHRKKKEIISSVTASSQRDNSNEVVREKFDGCSRPSSTSGVWSESNFEDKSLDSDTSSSQSESVHFVTKLMLMSNDSDNRDQDFGFCDETEFCDQSPFRFVLQTSPPSPSSGRRTPEFSSPVRSPARRCGKSESKEENVGENSKELEEEEEEKEQLSPVSVLDPPFEDDYDGREDEDEDVDAFDIETSYAIVQRTKQQLLEKLRRFERLAELDPIELEKRMLEEVSEDEEIEDHESNSSDTEVQDADDFVLEILSKSSYQCHRAPGHMKRLVSDLIVEEQNQVENGEELEAIVAKRFESWKEVQSNTIDMMVEQDFKKELQGIWKSNNEEQIGDTAIEIELQIFGLLVDELAHELVCLSQN